MRSAKLVSGLIQATIGLGVIVSVASLVRTYFPWLAELCGLPGSDGCSHADLYELIGLPLGVWGLAFYSLGFFVYRISARWMIIWLMTGAGVELALIHLMLSENFFCFLCLINAGVVLALVLLHLGRLCSWHSLAVCLMGYVLVSPLIRAEFASNTSSYASLTGHEILARVNNRAITLADLESEIAVPLSEMRKQIYYLKRSKMEELIQRALADHGGVSQNSNETDPSIFPNNTPEETDQRARQFLTELQRNDSAIDRYLERPISPFAQVYIDESPTIGPATAKVTVVEFFDFRCPMCKKNHGILKELKAIYKDDVRWVFKDYPSQSHAGAEKLAEAARCAQEQGRYWEFYDAIFSGDKKTEADLPRLAQAAGLNVDAFGKCFESKKYTSAVQRDIADARKLGIPATPAYIINGRLFDGPMSIDNFKNRIDEALAQ